LEVEKSLVVKFPGLQVKLRGISGVIIQKNSPELEELKRRVGLEIRSKYTLGTLKDAPTFRAYRDFFWRVGIDPTKIRPAAEALIRRILADKPIPNINTLVDAYNLASIRTEIALAAFDLGKLVGGLTMRQARAGEGFLGIGMGEPMQLKGDEVVVADEEKLIAVYPYRDADSSKVTESTRNVQLMTCGCPGIDEALLSRAEQVALEIILRFCDGTTH